MIEDRRKRNVDATITLVIIPCTLIDPQQQNDSRLLYI
jgi:hypothetical protein